LIPAVQLAQHTILTHMPSTRVRYPASAYETSKLYSLGRTGIANLISFVKLN